MPWREAAGPGPHLSARRCGLPPAERRRRDRSRVRGRQRRCSARQRAGRLPWVTAAPLAITLSAGRSMRTPPGCGPDRRAGAITPRPARRRACPAGEPVRPSVRPAGHVPGPRRRCGHARAWATRTADRGTGQGFPPVRCAARSATVISVPNRQMTSHSYGGIMRRHKPRRGAGTAKALAAGRQDAAAAPGPQAPARVRDIGRMRAGSIVVAATSTARKCGRPRPGWPARTRNCSTPGRCG